MFEVKSTSGKLLFSADEQEVVVGAERLRVMGEWPADMSEKLKTAVGIPSVKLSVDVGGVLTENIFFHQTFFFLLLQMCVAVFCFTVVGFDFGIKEL